MLRYFDRLETDAEGVPSILKRIPDTKVRAYLRGLELLTETQRKNALAVAINHGNQFLNASFFPREFERPENFEEIQAVSNLGIMNLELKETSALKTLRQLSGAMKSSKPGAKRLLGGIAHDRDLIERVDSTGISTAVEIRRELAAKLSGAFGLEAEDYGGGVWRYSSTSEQLGLEVDYGGSMGQQLRYTLVHPQLRQSSLELMLGIAVGDWNFIHPSNLDDSLEALLSIYDFYRTMLAEQAVSPKSDRAGG